MREEGKLEKKSPKIVPENIPPDEGSEGEIKIIRIAPLLRERALKPPKPPEKHNASTESG